MDTVTVIVTPPGTDGGFDDDGNAIPGTNGGGPVTFYGCKFAPRSSAERSDSRVPAILTDATLYMTDPRAPTVVTAAAKLTVLGRGDYEVEGDVGIWGDAGVEVAVTTWRGAA